MKSNWPWYATRVWHAYSRTGLLLCRPFRDAFTSHSRSNNSHLRRKTEFMNGNAAHLRGCGARHRPRSKSSRKRKSSITMTSSLPWSWSPPRSGSEIRDKNFLEIAKRAILNERKSEDDFLRILGLKIVKYQQRRRIGRSLKDANTQDFCTSY